MTRGILQENRRHSPSAIRLLTCLVLTILLPSWLVTFAAARQPTGYERTMTVSQGLNAPTAVAVDDLRNLYIVESSRDRLLITDSEGAPLASLGSLKKPISVAIGLEDRIYVGCRGDGSVRVFSYDLEPALMLGRGEHEFVQPGGIALDSSGNAYVVDSRKDEVKVFDSEGELLFSFGSSGNEEGSFHFPTAIALSEALNQVVVTDLQVQGSMYGDSEGARVQLFDLDGIYLRSVGEYGVGDGMLTKPMGVALDSEGGIYVSDAYQNIVQLFDNTGEFVGSISSDDYALRNPLGLAIDDSKQVIVASLNSSGVDLYSQPVPVGSLNVQTNLESACFTLSGPESFSGCGLTWQEDNVAVGTYTIVFDELEGYSGPEPQSGELEEGGVLTFAAEYEPAPIFDPAALRVAMAFGPGRFNPARVQVYGFLDQELKSEFSVESYGYGASVAACDLNGDGEDELIASPGPGSHNPAELSVFTLAGEALAGLTTTAFDANYGAYLYGADLDQDGRCEVIAGSGAGSDAPTLLRIFGMTESGMELASSGIELQAFDTGVGVRPAAGDVDCDGALELVTAPGPNKENPALIRVWDIDTSGGFGAWTTRFSTEFSLSSEFTYGASVAAGDFNGDGCDEILAGFGPDPLGDGRALILDGNGKVLTEIWPDMGEHFGVNVSAGDVDGDGQDEILVGGGAGPSNKIEVKVLDLDGSTLFHTEVPGRFGANPALGVE